MKNIIIVESPSKSKTIESYMGSDFKVLSSVGHIRDLATSGKDGLGIDIENGFTPNYTIIKGKSKIVADLKKECKGKKVYLATDPDREGEAISYHLAEILGLDLNEVNRIEFHEITKPAIIDAFNHPRKIDMDLVSSQETRRMLDRIIGFKVSKLLQSKIKSKSAGRVQSVALKLICDLEREIKAFIPESYYELEAIFDRYKLEFLTYKNEKIYITDKNLALEIKNSLNNEFIVDKIESKETKRESKPPFTTSTLQQDASNKLNFSSSKTMKIAQALYEGKNIGTMEVGLISYMRTDSTSLSDLFVNETKKYIISNYGNDYLGYAKQRDQKLAQNAHEAIRPTSILRTPESLSNYLSNDEYKLYKLIYNRTLASLMSGAKFLSTKITFNNNETTWKLNGQTLLFDGYLVVSGKADEDENALLPLFNVGESYKAKEIIIKDLETKPKTRYTEASLIKDMEELGIGRPSTYAQTMLTLTERAYVEIKEKKIFPTEQGMLTSEKLNEFFLPIFNVEYTANMEESLDKISKGEESSLKNLKEFYNDFEPILDNAKKNMQVIAPKETGELCPMCNSPLVIRKGRYGEFVACSNYPACKYILEEKKEELDTGIICPICGKGHFVKKMANKGRNKGKYFFACSNYPDCKTAFSDEPTTELCPNCNSMMLRKDGNLICSKRCDEENKEESAKEGIICPSCGKGHIVKKIAKKGRNAGNAFYACSNYPRCKNIYSLEPTEQKCKNCGSVLLKDENNLVCSNKDCK